MKRSETFISLFLVVVAWQLASYFFPVYLFPPVNLIGAELLALIVDQQGYQALSTFARILAGMAGAFIFGGFLAFLMGRSDLFNRLVYPVVNLLQGVPALSWVVIAIIWFRHTEFRIWFIMVATTLPAFTFQLLDSYRAISKDLMEMTLSFRPSRLDYLRVLVLPTVVPGILTAWKVNLGNASRVVVVAELVGATSGIGYQLLQSQQLFNLAAAIAWTITLVVFVLITQSILIVIENRVLRYRATSERGL
ncbi:MAG: ABC transporter permease subunit [Rhodospirillales bacterium]|nr:ABC transporter permease subunit [Rhodospirillales bacterium]